MAALTRSMSTMLNGLQVDEAQFRRDVDRLVKGADGGGEAVGPDAEQEGHDVRAVAR